MMSDSSAARHGAELRAMFGALEPVIEIAEAAQAELDRRAATSFSMFDYFYERETDLSRIFAGLLDPRGSHGQGTLFLRLLLHGVSANSEFKVPDRSGDLDRCQVHLEFRTSSDRRIDIALNIGDRWIGIENKPWAGDGKDQLTDYLEFLRTKDRDAFMLYWSGKGQDPKNEGSAKKDIDWAMMPYRKDPNGDLSVEAWLHACWRECAAERVRWFLTDLIEYVRRYFRPSQNGSKET